jgi:predicted lipoprotein with Yx(FWY)xxD motif
MKLRLLLLVPLMIGFLQAASVDDLTFTLNDDGVSYSVTDCDTAAIGEMIIPSTYNSLPVTSIGNNAFYRCTSLTSITIPDSVTSIGEEAFYYCTSLTSITIPDGVTSIGGSAFFYCTSLTSATIPSRVAPQLANIGFTGNLLNNLFYSSIAEVLQEDSNFVAKLAEAMIAAENNSGLATKEDLPIAIQQGVDQVIADPSAHNLATTAAVTQARTDGRRDVIDNSADYNLYSESSILEMNVSNPTLSMLNETQQAQVEFTLETSTDLEDWTIEERIQRTVQATEDQFFVRISSGVPYVTPTVLVFNHPSYGEILTDQDGNVLYGFSIDSAGGDPLYSGSSWPLASHSTDPEPDADVTAALTSGTYSNTSGGPWLKINDRPVYTYAGDSELNQASGHGQGSVWFTIRPDGSLNQ